MVTDLLIIVGGAMQLIDTPVKANIGTRTSTTQPHKDSTKLPPAKQDSAMQDPSNRRRSSTCQYATANENDSVHGSEAAYGSGHAHGYADGSVTGFGGSFRGSVSGLNNHKQQLPSSAPSMSRCSSMASSYTGSDGE